MNFNTFLIFCSRSFRRKQITIESEYIPGVWIVDWQIGKIRLHSTFYTRIDQACILWGLISAAIFFTAQFFPLNWGFQAILWTVISLVGTVGMVMLTDWWVRLERIEWVLYAWVILMLGGIVVTDLSIWLGWGNVLMHLCDIWLGLVALGYFCTGAGMRSRTFALTGLVHLLSIWLLPYVGGWQFFTTGAVMGGSVLLLAELEWDSQETCGSYKEIYKRLASQEHPTTAGREGEAFGL